jgi:hypothetical protein
MRILIIDSFCHHKNKNAFLHYDNIVFHSIERNHMELLTQIDLSHYDVVYNPSEPMDVSKYPYTKFIFGPHFSVFPDDKINRIKGSNSIYIQPSEWAANAWINYNNGINCNGLNIKTLPFGVDTTKFNEIKPIQERDNVFIYFKHRNPQQLQLLMYFLNTQNIQFKLFNYSSRYSEEDYIHSLKESKYGIWLGSHESQGFALEEALSCNVPLFVWNVKTLADEYISKMPEIYATTIPYWNESCGEVIYEFSEINNKFQLFLSKLNTYQPRKYIIENLSFQKCQEKLVDLINNGYGH